MHNYQTCDCDPLEYCEHRQKRDQIWINTAGIFRDSMERSKQLAIDATKGIMMAKYDHGGGCPCGLYKECDPGCTEYKGDKIKCNCDHQFDGGGPVYHVPGGAGCRFNNDVEYNTYHDRMKKEWPEMKYDEHEEKPVLESATRPWGIWRVLDVDQGYKVKRLEILPDAAISLQYHNHRSEYWTIVQGSGKVIIDGNIFTVEKGDSFYVPKQALHKVTNTHLRETLIAIEVQMGDICSEDDIVRC